MRGIKLRSGKEEGKGVRWDREHAGRGRVKNTPESVMGHVHCSIVEELIIASEGESFIGWVFPNSFEELSSDDGEEYRVVAALQYVTSK